MHLYRFQISCTSKNVFRHFSDFSNMCALTRISHARDSFWKPRKRYQSIVSYIYNQTEKKLTVSLTLKLSLCSFIQKKNKTEFSRCGCIIAVRELWFHSYISDCDNLEKRSKQTDESFIRVCCVFLFYKSIVVVIIGCISCRFDVFTIYYI